MNRLLGVAIVIIGLGAVGAWYFLGDEDVANKPLVRSASIGNVENVITAAGRLQPSINVEIGAQVSGQLQRIFVDVGDIVERGQLLAEIDATVQINKVAAQSARLASLRAQIPSREASLKFNQARAERQRNLMAEEATSQTEFESANQQLTQSRASIVQLSSDIAQAEATLALEEASLGYAKIYAPLAGTVVSLTAKEGQTLNSSQMTPLIMNIADLQEMSVHAEVSEADIDKLHIGMRVYFRTLGSGSRQWESTVQKIQPKPSMSDNVVVYPVIFDIDNNDGALLPDMTAQVFFVRSAVYDVTTIPLGAVRRDKSGSYVEVVDVAGQIERRGVEIGLTSRINAEVLNGIEPGESVVAGVLEVEEAERNERSRRFYDKR